MRIMSVSQMKGHWKNHTLGEAPGVGTKIRLVWDRLHANKASFISITDIWPKANSRGQVKAVLIDTYGLDIAYKPKGIWCLVGEWKGKEYVDYLAEKYK